MAGAVDVTDSPPPSVGRSRPTEQASGLFYPRPARLLAQGDDVLDARGFAQEQLAVVVERMAASDHLAQSCRPALLKNGQVPNGVLKGGAIGIDRPDDRLVHQHHLA